MSALEYRALTRVEAGCALEFNTLLFSNFWKSRDFQSETPRSIRILDLGHVQSSSIDFFSNYPCYITITDAIEKLAGTEEEDEVDEDAQRAEVEALVPLQSQPYDLILAWDCLNYLSPAVFPLVYQRLIQACHKHSHVHGFLYTSQMRYSMPWQFFILADDKMACHANQGIPIHTTPMNSLTLMKKMPDFTMERSVLMRNGMQEFMIRRDG